MLVGGAEWNHIVENKVSGCDKAGIKVEPSSRNLIKENKVVVFSPSITLN